jgi:Cu(I)/Ag(I) efflux system membrane protein CusA/SilA
MTVSTVIAGLLPIMWSTSVGAEVMKPLATPVLGGMISSLVHVLIVTPVIFFWIHERRLEIPREPPALAPTAGGGTRRRVVALAAIVVAMVGAYGVWRLARAPTIAGDSSRAGTVVQTIRPGDLEIVLRSPTGTLRTGRNTFTIEFRSPSGEALPVRDVRAAATMPMPGMAMTGNLRVSATGVPGLFTATAEFGMAGTWQMRIDWDGPAGRGSASFEGVVQ